MKRTSRALAAVVAASALTFTGVHTADAKPAHAGSHAKAPKADKSAKAMSGEGSAAKDPATKVSRHVARVLEQLGRATNGKRLAKLGDEDRTAVLANVATDQAAIEAVATRSELRAFRVENYRLSVNILRQAVKAAAAATEAGNADAAAGAATAAGLARAVTAQSPKSDLKDARAALSAALELLEPEEGELDESETGEDQLEEGDPESGDVDVPPGDDLPMLSEPVDPPSWTSGS